MAPVHQLPTYRQLQTPAGRFTLAAQIGTELDRGLVRFTVSAVRLFDDPQRRPIIVVHWTPGGYDFVDGRPYDETRGHFIRVRRATMPAHVDTTYVMGCGMIDKVEPIVDDIEADPLLPVDERLCRGPFTAIMCEADRCWVAGWY